MCWKKSIFIGFFWSKECFSLFIPGCKLFGWCVFSSASKKQIFLNKITKKHRGLAKLQSWHLFLLHLKQPKRGEKIGPMKNFFFQRYVEKTDVNTQNHLIFLLSWKITRNSRNKMKLLFIRFDSQFLFIKISTCKCHVLNMVFKCWLMKTNQ